MNRTTFHFVMLFAVTSVLYLGGQMHAIAEQNPPWAAPFRFTTPLALIGLALAAAVSWQDKPKP